jgi:hypothetical protein
MDEDKVVNIFRRAGQRSVMSELRDHSGRPPVMINIYEVLYYMSMTEPEPTSDQVFNWLLARAYPDVAE